MKLLISIILFSLSIKGQNAIKDTIIEKVTYHFASYRADGTLKTLSQNKTEKEGGRWIYFDANQVMESQGDYNKNGKKEGDWYFYSKDTFYYRGYKNGKKISRTGHGFIGEF